MAKLLAALFAALLLCGAARAVTVSDFMNDPKFQPFLKKALAADGCLADPAVANGSLDLDKCPSLLGLLDALNQGKTEYPVECEPECADSFYTLSAECLDALTLEFNKDPEPVGVLGSIFLADCAAVKNGGFAPSPAMPPSADGMAM